MLAAKIPAAGEAVEVDEQAVRSIIENAGKSNIESVKLAGAQLDGRYSAWLRTGAGGEAAQAQDDLLDAVGRVRSACIGAGVIAA